MEPLLGMASKEAEPFFFSFSSNPDKPALQIEIILFDPQQFGGPDAGAVEDFQNGSVTQAFKGCLVGDGKKPFYIGKVEKMGKARLFAWSAKRCSGIGGDDFLSF